MGVWEGAPTHKPFRTYSTIVLCEGMGLDFASPLLRNPSPFRDARGSSRRTSQACSAMARAKCTHAGRAERKKTCYRSVLGAFVCKVGKLDICCFASDLQILSCSKFL